MKVFFFFNLRNWIIFYNSMTIFWWWKHYQNKRLSWTDENALYQRTVSISPQMYSKRFANLCCLFLRYLCWSRCDKILPLPCHSSFIRLSPLYMMSPFSSHSKVKGLCCLCSCPNSSLRPSYVCDKMLQFFRWYLSLVTLECTMTLLKSGSWKMAEGNSVFCVLSFLRLKIVFKIKSRFRFLIVPPDWLIVPPILYSVMSFGQYWVEWWVVDFGIMEEQVHEIYWEL